MNSEVVLIVVVVALIGVIVYLITQLKSRNDDQDKSKLVMEQLLTRYSEDIKADIKRNVVEDMYKNNERIQDKLTVNHRETQKTISSIMEQVGVLKEAQKGIKEIHTDVRDLQNVLTDKSSRGAYGEVQLYAILEAIFGNNRDLFSTQYTISEAGLVDAVVFGGETIGLIPIDSKFPLEDYLRMNNATDEVMANNAKKDFKASVKLRIDETSKYIRAGETSEMAIMFVPSEAIFAEINTSFEDVILYAQRKNVWIASPTTIMAILTLVQQTVRDVNRDKNIMLIQEELSKLAEDFTRFNTRWEGIKSSLSTVNNKIEEEDKSVNKIIRKFDKIADTKIKE